MLYDIQKNNNKKIIVLTPTGRASQRIKDIDCNINTMTIHKVLCSVGFYFKEKQINHVVNNLDYDHVIIDEASMIDSFLLYSILKVIPNYCYITFLGDACQLPPIGLGSPFNLLIKYKFISIYYLTKIFRQKNASVLLNIAKKISDGICPKISSFNEEDCVFKVVKKEYIKNTLSEYINKYYDKNNNILNFQIITFLNRGICGVNNINLFIQNYIKEHFQSCLLLLLKKFYQYDRVVVLKNNYNLNIRNGEIGIIIDGNENELIVLFNDEKKIIFNENDIHLLQLAYAINIYKSQGSEFQNILILLYLEQYILLNKKALYTALTRAKKTAVIIGETKALYCAINNKNNCNRNTFLELFLEGN
jgi:exodeoxyribonuclease V alpha subunit